MANLMPIAAAPSERLLALRLTRGGYRYNAEGELERRCSRCRCYWPADSEFFSVNKGKSDGLRAYCKSCAVETRDSQEGN